MELVLNGQPRTFAALGDAATIVDLLADLALKSDRVAIEHNGLIVSRTLWASTKLSSGDRLEIVHFVGGGCGSGQNLRMYPVLSRARKK